MNAKLLHEALPVLFHRLDTNAQLGGDLFVGQTLGDELKNLDLAVRSAQSELGWAGLWNERSRLTD